MVIVVGRIGGNGLIGRVADHGPDGLQKGLIVAKAALFLIIKTIESHILQGTASSGGGKGIGFYRRGGNLSPLRGGIPAAAIDRHTALVEFLSVVEHILAHFPEVDIELAAIAAVVASVGKGIHQPELNILYVGCFEVVGVQFAHHASPSLRWIRKCSVGIQVGIQVIGTSLLRIIGKVQHGLLRRGSAVGALVAVGEKLAHINLAHIMVRKLFEVAADVSWRERRTLACEQRVDVVPCQQRTVVAALHGRLV